jgi:phosphinothricin acetyltransferase
MIRMAAASDAAALAKIYNHYVRETIVTFEEEPVSDVEMARRLADVQAASLPWLVAQEDGGVVGYACARPWKPRRGYRFSTEVSIYLDASQGGRGLGTLLYAQLLSELRTRGVHAAMGGIALPNDASVKLHERLGFEKVAHFREVGSKFGEWIDVGYWEKIFEP